VDVAKAEPAKKPEAAKKPEIKTAAAKFAPEKPRVSKIDAKLAADLKAPATKAKGSGGN
jgi:hypothetical protein